MSVFKIIITMILILTFSGCQNKVSEENILHQLTWDDREITIYNPGDDYIAYTDGEKNYSTLLQTMDSSNGNERFFLHLSAGGVEYSLLQDGIVIKPLSSFIFSQYTDEQLEQALNQLKTIGLIDDTINAEEIDFSMTCSIYSLDKSKDTSLSASNMPEYIARRWEDYGNYTLRGYPVNFTLEELNEMISLWNKTDLIKSQITYQNRTLILSWEGVSMNKLIYENGMQLHVPTIEISVISLDDQQYIEVENRMDYSSASVHYYTLTDEQWSELDEWKAALTLSEIG